MTGENIHIVLNPHSAAGTTSRKLDRITGLLDAAFRNRYQLHVTNSPFEARRVAAEAARHPSSLLIAVGGDGTIQEVVNGMFADNAPGESSCEFGLISSGTGHGFADSLGLPPAWAAQAAILACGHCRSIDLFRVTFLDWTGHTAQRYVVNECQLGIGGSVVRNVHSWSKKCGGRLAFGLGTLQGIFTHRNQPMSIMLDDTVQYEGDFTGMVVANGAFTGGGMQLAPDARLDDGFLSIVLMNNLTIPGRLRGFPKIYSGTHLAHRGFSGHRARSVKITACEPVLIEADGELLGTTQCTVEVIPAALRVRSYH